MMSAPMLTHPRAIAHAERWLMDLAAWERAAMEVAHRAERDGSELEAAEMRLIAKVVAGCVVMLRGLLPSSGTVPNR